MITSNVGHVQHNEDYQMIELFKQYLAPGASQFALAMAKLLYNPSGVKNLIFSPINIYSALALVLLGADGEPFDEIITLMGLPRGINDEEKHQLHYILGKVQRAIENTTDFHDGGGKNLKANIKITNGIFVQEYISLVPSYVTQAQSYYRSQISNVDFCNNSAAATEIINQFISQSTQQRIPRLFQAPLDSSNLIVLASCVYFKATWSEQFPEGATRDENFNTGSGNVLVKMMHLTKDLPYIHLPQLHLEAVSLSYKGNDVSMIVILPKPPKTVNDVLSSLRVEDLHLIADQTPSANVDLKLPRMKFKWISDINHYLAQLGLRQVFTDQSQLSKMTGPIPIKITKVTHAAEIEVDENETKATAVTVIGMAFGCGPRIPKPRKQFHVNRPFVFYIHHRITKSILFLGAVHNPQQG